MRASFILLVALASTDVVGQAPPTLSEITATVNRLLASDDAQEVAWGAFNATQYHLADAIPQLTSALTRVRGKDDVSQRAMELSILDALIQLDAHVPAEWLEPLVPRWPIPTAILLTTATGTRDAVLLRMLDSTEPPLWTVAANLLLAGKSPAFAARLLSGLQLELVVQVVSRPGIGGGGGGASGEHGMVGVMAKGFPPLAHYNFSPLQPGATVLSVGPDTVYYTRRMMSEPVMQPLNYSNPRSIDHYARVKYINALVAERFQTVPLREPTIASVVWTTADDLLKAVAGARRALEETYQRTLSLLVLAGRLTEAEKGTFAPNISVRLEDMRTDKSVPLPSIR